MIGSIQVFIWVLTGLIAVLTGFFNLYIITMSVGSYRQHKHWTPSETIITALSVANSVHQLVCYFWMTMDGFDRYCYMPQTVYSLMQLSVFSLKFTIMWNSAFLTFYYSTKLVISPIHCYTKIQEAIMKHVTTVVLLIPLFGLGACSPMLVVLHPHNNTAAGHDCGVITPTDTSGDIYEVVHLILADVLPGLVMLKCCVSISVHLALHLHHMKATTNGSHGPKLGTQLRVIRMTLMLVALDLSFLVVDLYVHYQMSVEHEDIIGVSLLFTSVYTTFSAVVLIYGKKTFWKNLLHSYNIGLDEFPCLVFLKVPETKNKNNPAHPVKH
ncbi:uncharacterized protein LOC124463877 [Hypomesus transpacificus]|uniref:uncharacterized protein LOC124463877 n=1 Tax=Hypomesus transpacificus TaxID=137520 RepID=UPI001F0832BE|nr:uncharacterized protein LOC124463877 [Hypomesus transpacificus]